MLFKSMLLGLIKKHKILFFAMTFISALTIGFASGLLSTYFSFEQNTTNYLKEYSYPDIEYEFNKLEEEEKIINLLKNNEGVEKVEASLQAQLGTLRGEAHLLFRSIDDDSFLKYYSYNEEKYNEEYPNIYLNVQFCTNNNLKAGDTILVTLPENPDEAQRCNVSRIVTSPSLTYFDLHHTLPVDKFDYGYCIINKSELKRSAEKFIPEDIREKYINKTNRLIVKVKDNYNKNDVYNKCTNSLKECLKEDDAKISYSRCYTTINPYDSNLDQLWNIAFLIPLVFVVITLILISLFMFQIVRNDVREIGILNAIGISKITICGIFVILSITIGILSSLIGLGISAIVGYTFYNLCTSLFNMPFGGFLLNAPSLFISLGVIIAILVLASAATFLIIKKVSPIEVMINKANRYKPLPKSIEKLTKNSSVNTKLTVNTVHKNLSRFILSIFTVSLVYTIVFTALNFRTSINHSINQTYAVNNFDAQVYKLDDSVDEKTFLDDIKSIDYVKKAESTVAANVSYRNGNKTFSQRMIGLAPDRELFKFTDSDGNECKIEDDGLIIESEYAKYLNAKIGDTIYINSKIPLKLTAICKLSSIKFGYTSYKTAKKIFTKNDITYIDCALVKIRDQKYQEFTHKVQMNIHYDVHTVFINKYLGTNFEGFEVVNVASLIIIMFAILIALVVTALMGLTILNEQKRKFSIMRTLGFDVSSISKQVLIQTLNYFFLGIIIGIPIAIPISKFALTLTNQLDTTLYFTNYWWLYILSIVLVALFITISHIILTIKVKKWNIVDNLKTRE